MLKRVQAYLSDRLRDPVAWLAISFLGSWLVAAGFGVSPFGFLNAVCLVTSALEWGAILGWKQRERRLRAHASVILPPAADRWKVACLAGLAIVTLSVELWVDVLQASAAGVGLTVFGISSLVTLWYAWSRPLLVLPDGLLVGVETVPWQGVRRVLFGEDGVDGAVRIEFRRANYFYGTKLRIRATASQHEKLMRLLPTSIRREEGSSETRTVAQPNRGLNPTG